MFIDGKTKMPSIWYRDIHDFLSYENLKIFIPRYDMTYEEMLNSIVRFTLYFVGIAYFLHSGSQEDIFPVKKAVLCIIAVLIFTFFMYEYLESNGKVKERTEHLKFQKIREAAAAMTSVSNQQPSNKQEGRTETVVKTEQEDASRSVTLEPNRQSRPCNREPTPNNPFMNVLVSDYMKDQKKHYNDLGACDIESSSTKEKIEENFNDNLFRDIGDVFSKNASDRQYYTTPNTQIPNNQTEFAHWLYKSSPRPDDPILRKV